MMPSCQNSLDARASAQITCVPKLITALLTPPVELALPGGGMTIDGVTIFAWGVAGEAKLTFGCGLATCTGVVGVSGLAFGLGKVGLLVSGWVGGVGWWVVLYLLFYVS